MCYLHVFRGPCILLEELMLKADFRSFRCGADPQLPSCAGCGAPGRFRCSPSGRAVPLQVCGWRDQPRAHPHVRADAVARVPRECVPAPGRDREPAGGPCHGKGTLGYSSRSLRCVAGSKSCGSIDRSLCSSVRSIPSPTAASELHQ